MVRIRDSPQVVQPHQHSVWRDCPRLVDRSLECARVTLAKEGLFVGVAYWQDNKNHAPLLPSSQHNSMEGLVLWTVKEVMATLILLTHHRRAAEQSGGGPISDTGRGL